MQACLENAAMPLLESSSLPLLESSSWPLLAPNSLPFRESTPAWTIRVARPNAPDRNELARELRGVPKAALRQVFGTLLGTRLWQQHRATGANAPASAKAAPVAAICAHPSATPIAAISSIPDTEIASGMLRYLCAEAAAALRERTRLAKSISLTVLYSDGESESVRQSLSCAANDASSLEAAARLAMRNMRSNAFVSLKLDLTAMPARP
jgi:hypothetical protein